MAPSQAAFPKQNKKIKFHPTMHPFRQPRFWRVFGGDDVLETQIINACLGRGRQAIDKKKSMWCNMRYNSWDFIRHNSSDTNRKSSIVAIRNRLPEILYKLVPCICTEAWFPGSECA